MKVPPGRARMAVLIVGTLAVLALAISWSARRGPAGFAAPTDCLNALCEASMEGDAARYLDCLAEPLRAETRRRFAGHDLLGDHLRLNMQGVMNWVQHPQGEGSGPAAVIDLEEVRASSRRVTRFRLEQSGRGWLIVGIGQPEEKPAAFRYGASVDEAREGRQPMTEP